MKKWIAGLLSAAMTLTLCACSGLHGRLGSVQPRVAVEYPNAIGFEDYDAGRTVFEQNPVDDSFIEAMAGFSWRTASAVLGSAQGNANYSPLSLYFALALAGTGAGGQTQAQIFDLLGTSNAEELSAQCGNLYRLLYKDHGVTKLKLANSLWMDRGVAFKDSFVRNAADNFYASFYSVDFADASAGKAMGQWVSQNTNGTLSPDFPVDGNKILSILNTVYYHDEWMDRFDQAKTAKDVFHGPQGDMTVDFMNQTFGSGSFAKGDGFTRSSLGLKGARQMVFILPDEGVGLDELLASPERVRALFEGEESSHGEVVWKVPKFSFDCRYELADVLKSLGVTDAFRPDADFSGITGGTAFITDVTQQTHIAIDENGVEASAFTEIAYAGAAPPNGRAKMILDRPFIYAITARGETPLFVGVCSNPGE